MNLIAPTFPLRLLRTWSLGLFQILALFALLVGSQQTLHAGLPTISAQPTSTTVYMGGNATFSVTASGNPVPTYQWRKNGVVIAGATSNSYLTPTLTTADHGSLFSVSVTNSFGTVTSSAANLTVNGFTITSQPANQTVAVGATATFQVTASPGAQPYHYTWQKNNQYLPDAYDQPTYTTPVTTLADSGSSYSVIVSDGFGQIGSNYATLTVALPPTITTQPKTIKIAPGSTTTFSVVGSSTLPLSYQWQKDGVAIPGATSTTYTTPTAVNQDHGSTFRVVVSNSVGSVTSQGANLNIDPRITSQPLSKTVSSGATASFSVTMGSSGTYTYQWFKNGVAVTAASSNSITYTTPVTALADSGSVFYVVITSVNSPSNTATSTSATLTVVSGTPPTITTQPTSVAVASGNPASFTVAASGTSPFSYQWRKNGTAIAGATAATYVTPALATTDSGALFSVVVTNTAGSATSANATVTVNAVAPSVSAPASTSVVAGSTATFSVTASGSAPFTYQWKKNGIAIAGANAAAHTTPTLTTADNGALYSVLVLNSVGSVASANAILTVTPALPPTVTTQPDHRAVVVGASATFNVGFSGTEPITFQWTRNGVAIPGATSVSYSTPATTTADNGATYSVTLSNFVGTATSINANLAVSNAPVITVQPSAQTVTAGQIATFSITAIGNPAPTYQWRRNSIPIAGATSSTYTFTTALADTAASFDVVVTNSLGNITSAAALLTVTHPITGVATDVTTANVPSGGLLNVTAWVQGTGSFNPNLTWTATGGYLSVTQTTSGVSLAWTAPAAKGTYTLKATAVDDTTKFANITVTVSLSGLAWKRDIVYLGGKEVAEIDSTGTHTTLTDHLGSPRILVNPDGSIIQQKFAPFGESLTNPTDAKAFAKGFTNHEQTDPSGLIYMQARFYLPQYHRFGSPDPALDQHFEFTQSWNIYSYVQNMPTIATDPNGQEIRFQSHKVLGESRQHASLKIIPKDQARYAGNPNFQRGKDGKLFMTLGAGPENNSPINWGHLTAAPNRDKDMNKEKTSSTELALPKGEKDENKVIDGLIKSGENFDNHKIDYEAFPTGDNFNSNSYLHGLLDANGFTEKEGVPSQMPNNPGWDKPVPADAFKPGAKADPQKAHPPTKTQEERRREKLEEKR